MRSSGGWLSVSHRGELAWRPGPSMSDLWWSERHWDRFISDFFCSPLSVSFHRCFVFSHISLGDGKGTVSGSAAQKSQPAARRKVT
jgi:hypothetical protein